MKQTWLPQGHSDPLSYTCICPASTSGGQVLLFYRYFSASPPLPQIHQTLAQTPSHLADFQSHLCKINNLSGKIRIAPEGFNITVGGTTSSIANYITTLLTHWSLSSLGLTPLEEPSPSKRQEKIDRFFKPTKGCRCVFGGGDVSVKTVEEITPMGVTGYVPRDWGRVEDLSPQEWDRICREREEGGKEMLLLDVRNFYESRIGFFVGPGGGEAVRLGIRRFSQWPQYVNRFLKEGGTEEDGEGKEKKEAEAGRNILAYCTGGIRCEKGVRYMEEKMGKREGDRVCTLKGGIAAYLTWMDGEIKAGRKRPEDSLFKGKNYVFDARGSIGLENDGDEEGKEGEPVAVCHCCGNKCDRLSKCRSRGCHLVLVVCGQCEVIEDVRCCGRCKKLDEDLRGEAGRRREMCDCEKEREEQLWGRKEEKVLKTQGWKKEKRERERIRDMADSGIDVRIRTIDS